MTIDRERIRAAIYATFETTRLTYDIPILRDVWVDYACEPAKRQDLLLTPFEAVDPGRLAFRLRGDFARVFGEEALRKANVAFNRAAVVGKLTYHEMLALALPLTAWWQGTGRPGTPPPAQAAFARLVDRLERSRAALESPGETLAFLRANGARKADAKSPALPPEILRLAAMAGFIHLRATAEGASDGVLNATLDALRDGSTPQDSRLAPAYLAFADLAKQSDAAWRMPQARRRGSGRAVGEGATDAGPQVFRIQKNRPAVIAIAQSRQTVKADAAARVFEMPTKDIVWVVIDSGIDATHPAFATGPAPRARRGAAEAAIPLNRSRIRRTFDFTVLRDVLSGKHDGAGAGIPQEKREELELRLASGRAIDWSLLQHFIEITPDRYRKPEPGNEHGTHVAGIIGANWPREASGLDHDLVGICPDISLVDMRVFRMENGLLVGDEFAIMAALQFVSYMNRAAVKTVVHGVNLSLAIEHDVQNYACGRTPVCNECERLVNSGVVVVAAAGNAGHQKVGPAGYGGGYADISIVDPGNAEGVITVGATHKLEPHSYGVSFFSSRGPTGDGRAKPDLVAPGEKILAPVPGGDAKTMDGTSMAAPHVSGAAALLLARYRELIGQPGRVKQALMKSATDLGRERYFQGAGLLDVLRAMQSI